MNAIIAVPSSQPGGLDAEVYPYSCYGKFYTLVPVKEGEIKKNKVKGIEVRDLEFKKKEKCLLPEHYREDDRCKAPMLERGGCFSPLQWQYLFSNGVQTLIVGDVLDKQLLQLRSAFSVFCGAKTKDGEKIETVTQAVNAFIKERLNQLSELDDPRCHATFAECMSCPVHTNIELSKLEQR